MAESLLATVTSFDPQSRDSVARVTAGAEEKLRETFTKVFADMGDTLRDRMREIASNLHIAPPASPAPESTPAPVADPGASKTESEQ